MIFVINKSGLFHSFKILQLYESDESVRKYYFTYEIDNFVGRNFQRRIS